MPRALVIRAQGTNCDKELCRAFEIAGAEPSLRHLDALISDPSQIDEFDLIGFPGGFSYGDDIASGRIMAALVRERLYAPLRDAVLRGCPIIGICNGFQVLVQVGLLPGPLDGVWPTDRAPKQTCALTENAGARFIDRWVEIAPVPASRCVWTAGLDSVHADHVDRPHGMRLPIAHGEGRFVTDSPATLERLENDGLVALRYATDVNGSENAIAGICDASGRVFGLMPHPERFLEWNRHPYFTRLDSRLRSQETLGRRIFQNAVAAASKASRPSGRPQMV
ncbi:MAG: phosphoribosylformylglycinamidine synthase subunit PurQ [Phycisphaeraceae bacterium]|nr:phosphoribosylformylglycinamidine synthase subunit PurQ [Phycisphaeraceae bacterium]